MFDVDETGTTSDGYRILDRSSVKSMYISRCIAILILAAVIVPMLAFVPEFEDPVWASIPVAILVLAIVYFAISPQVFFRRYRYRIDGDKAEVRRGVITIRHVMVPIERIHQVDVRAGPINRMFGLADVLITTAGGEVSIQFLKQDVAEDVAEKLNASVVRMLKDRV